MIITASATRLDVIRISARQCAGRTIPALRPALPVIAAGVRDL